MSGIRRIWLGIGRLGENRWWWTFWAMFVTAQIIVRPNAYLTVFAVVYATLAGWHWAGWTRRRDMKRRNAIIVEGATRADVEAFIEELEWFVKQRKAGQR